MAATPRIGPLPVRRPAEPRSCPHPPTSGAASARGRAESPGGRPRQGARGRPGTGGRRRHDAGTGSVARRLRQQPSTACPVTPAWPPPPGSRPDSPNAVHPPTVTWPPSRRPRGLADGHGISPGWGCVTHTGRADTIRAGGYAPGPGTGTLPGTHRPGSAVPAATPPTAARPPMAARPPTAPHPSGGAEPSRIPGRPGSASPRSPRRAPGNDRPPGHHGRRAWNRLRGLVLVAALGTWAVPYLFAAAGGSRTGQVQDPGAGTVRGGRVHRGLRGGAGGGRDPDLPSRSLRAAVRGGRRPAAVRATGSSAPNSAPPSCPGR